MNAAYYKPLYIRKYQTGLVQDRENFILPEDAYPVLENAFVWRERIKRKSGCRLLGRLRRVQETESLGNLDGLGEFSGNIRSIFGLETTGELEPGSVVVTDGTNTWQDNGLGVLVGTPGGTGTINYSSMAITLAGGVALAALTIDYNYYPGLPVMGLRSQELSNINNERLIAFDTTYAYRYVNGWQEYIPGTTWTGSDFNFFWSTNYWVDSNNNKIFWVTNFSGTSGDPIRYTSQPASAWIDFAPVIDGSGNRLQQALVMLPFRSRMVTFNTREGPNLAGSTQFRQRIRWSAIGNPFSDVSALVTTVNADAWRDDIPGQGGFLDIPTAQDIVAVGFVRDNLVIFCERSTWQLRYTGRSIAPFQIEKVNTELGVESTFSMVQFDTSLVGIGDKGVVECDSYQSKRIDIKIPDLVYNFQNTGNGPERVQGVRDFQQRIAYWTYVKSGENNKFPNRRLMYNYENDSWAIFTDSYTTLGTYQPQSPQRWVDFSEPVEKNQWQNSDFPWSNTPSLFPSIVGGNQQGFVEFLGQLGFQTGATNDVSLTITDITGNTTTATRITSPNHNLESGQIITISNIPTGTPFATLNDGIFSVEWITANTFDLYVYNSSVNDFSTPQLNDPATYVGGGLISIKDNFKIQSKKFNFLETGSNIQLGFMDILMDTTSDGAITMNVYVDYNDTEPVNQYPENIVQTTNAPDTFFNTVIPTYSVVDRFSSKEWQRIYCSTRGAFLTLEFTFSNAQMNGNEQENDVQIDSQVLWIRPAGRQLARSR